MDCLFCTIQKEQEDNIYENEFFIAKFDSYPVTVGHALIIPKRHLLSILDLNKDEWVELQIALKEVVNVIENTDFRTVYKQIVKDSISDKSVDFCKSALNNPNIDKKPDGYNIGVNDGEAAGRTIHHLHIHIIPRYFGDVEDSIGGIRNIISGMGNYKR